MVLPPEGGQALEQDPREVITAPRLTECEEHLLNAPRHLVGLGLSFTEPGAGLANPDPTQHIL